MAVTAQNRFSGNEKHGKTPDAKIPDRVEGKTRLFESFSHLAASTRHKGERHI